MSIRKSQEQAVRAHVNLDLRIVTLIGYAQTDLNLGPGAVHADDYPGFTKACDEIRDALPTDDLWVSVDGDVSDTEPHWSADDDDDSEPGESPELWSHWDSSLVRRVLVGAELNPYV